MERAVMSSLEEIPLVPEGQFILHWIREAGREQQVLFLSEGEVEYNLRRAPLPGSTDRLQIDMHRRLILVDQDGTQTEMASFCGDRRNLRVQRLSENPDQHACFILNGNGFNDPLRTGLQDRLRNRVVREHGAWNVMVIPYDALNAAGIILETIEPIEITPDTNTNRTREILNVPSPGRRLTNRETQSVTHGGREWRFEGSTWGGDWYDNFGYNVQVRWQAPNRDLMWYRVTHQYDQVGSITWNEHRLGASIFWADADNGRHRYISAFDMQENPPMYFLAQLPDGPEVTDYDSAIAALAPPIVRQASNSEHAPMRHGDIFFIATGESDESLAMRGKIHKRANKGSRILVRGGAGGGSKWMDNPPSRRRNRRVTLLGTGHTADKVVKTEDGCTFACGTVRHEPFLIQGDEDRTADHRSLVLPRGVWYLCVRNTVPSL